MFAALADTSQLTAFATSTRILVDWGTRRDTSIVEVPQRCRIRSALVDRGVLSVNPAIQLLELLGESLQLFSTRPRYILDRADSEVPYLQRLNLIGPAMGLPPQPACLLYTSPSPRD